MKKRAIKKSAKSSAKHPKNNAAKSSAKNNSSKSSRSSKKRSKKSSFKYNIKKTKKTNKINYYKKWKNNRSKRQKKAEAKFSLILKYLTAYINKIDDLSNIIKDKRQQGKVYYTKKNILFSLVLLMFLKGGHKLQINRNNLDPDTLKLLDKFGIEIPSVDTLRRFVKNLNNNDLKELYRDFIGYLMKKAVFTNGKIDGYWLFSLDGSGLSTTSADDAWSTTKESKTGVKTYMKSFVAITLRISNGWAVIIDWEPINTTDGSSKEDCEVNASKRLLNRNKEFFRKVNGILIGDALYLTKPMEELLTSLNLDFLFVHKDSKIKHYEKQIKKQEENEELLAETDYMITNNKYKLGAIIYYALKSFNGKNTVNLIKATSITNQGDTKNIVNFEWIASSGITGTSLLKIIDMARSRQSIEDFFNRNKNRLGSLAHKFNYSNITAQVNWIDFTVLGDLLYSVIIASNQMQALITEKPSAKENLTYWFKFFTQYIRDNEDYNPEKFYKNSMLAKEQLITIIEQKVA